MKFPLARTILWLLACLLLADAEPGAASPPDGGDRPNVLLVTVDTLRPDSLGWVGGKNSTPHLDTLAEQGFRFPAAVSPVPVTLPAHASLLTGLIPRRHGVRDNGQLLAEGPRTLAEILTARGYRGAAFVSGFPLVAGSGIERGFAHYDDAFSRGREGHLERPARETTAAALQWIVAAPEPWFVWIHYYDPHDPYEPPAEFRRPGPRGAYDGEVAAVDAAIAALLAGLEKGSGKGRQRLTIFTADHGESLGEHGEKTHGFFLYESTVAVPLVFHWPGRIPPRQSEAAARLVDVLPTILDLLGESQAVPQDLDGISLRPLLAGEEQEVPAAYLETMRPWSSYGWAPLSAVRQGPWKLIVAPRPELYHLTSDPKEASNRIDEERPVARRLQAFWRQVRGRSEAVSQAAEDPETLARLRALGYAGAGESQRVEPPAGLPDPKDRIGLWNQLGEAERRLAQGDLGGALERFDEVLEADPANPQALARSGIVLVELGKAADAVPRLEKALERMQDNPDAHQALAHALGRLRRLDEAAQQWMEVVRLQPRRPDAWTALGNTLGASGKPAEAVEAFRQAVALEPDRAELQIRLAFALHAAGRIREAVERLRQAARLTGPGAFPHAGALGLLLAQMGKADEAVSWLAASRQGESEYGPARLELARLLVARGDEPAARRALAEALAAVPALRSRVEADPEMRSLLEGVRAPR